MQIVCSFHQGGSERQAVQLTHLFREDDIPMFFLITLNREGVMREEVEKIRFRIVPEFPLTSFYNLNFARQLRKCSRFIKENNIEIIHTRFLHECFRYFSGANGKSKIENCVEARKVKR